MLEQDFQNLKTNTVKGMLCVGKCLETGDGVGKDQAEAVKWYRMAAEHGLADAAFELAKCYRFGIGVRRNRTTALKWMRRAAEQGHTKAMVLLGMHHLNEFEEEYNPRKAVNLFRKAADHGDAWGMYRLGECFERGKGAKKDFDAAYLWFCRAVLAAPDDETLYQFVQNKIYDPNLKEVRDSLRQPAAEDALSFVPKRQPGTGVEEALPFVPERQPGTAAEEALSFVPERQPGTAAVEATPPRRGCSWPWRRGRT